MDNNKLIHTADSPNVLRVFRKASLGNRFVENCVDEHLVNLPAKTKLVLLLGNTDSYVKELRAMLVRRRGQAIPINEISYWVKGVKFVHLAHPSKGNGHFGAYVRGEGTPGKKLRWAKQGLEATA